MKKGIFIIYYFFIGLFVLFGQNHSNKNTNIYTADVIVYGGTPAAIISAVQVSKMGKSVIIVSPDKHLGGMSSSGLGFTDTGNKSVIGGLSREFYYRIYKYYENPETWIFQKKNAYGNAGQGTPAIDGEHKTMWIFEPNIAEKVFEDFINENQIKVYRDEWLNRKNGVKKENNKIISFKTLSNKTFKGKIFIDETYEGDLMAASGVKYVVGRESNKIYNEHHNGNQLGVFDHKHNFKHHKISPYINPKDQNSGILPRISDENPGKKGEGDQKIQAYCFRMCLTKKEGNKIPFEKPEGYDPLQYELLARLYKDGWEETFQKFDPIPNLKTDVNNHGPFSTDNIGMNYDYPEASYEQRKEIIKEHENYQKGLLYFISTDPKVPEKVQKEMQKWGFAKDEFQDNGNWPYQLYIREARRMIGEYVMTEHEILSKKKVTKPIGMGSYSMDSHNTQRYITSKGHVQNEGDVGVSISKPYAIDLGAIVPKNEECSNLLVPVALSSSHIAYGSIRMEPVFMILGQSAGIIAVTAIEKEIDISDLNYEEIKPKLIDAGQILERPKN